MMTPTAALSINDTKHNGILSSDFYCYAERRYADSHGALWVTVDL
jgi:hypothetical protein